MLFDTPLTVSEEAERLKSLLQYEILDTQPDPALDEITQLAAQLCRAPYAYIGFVDANRVWLKSRAGFREREISRSASACQYAVMGSQSLILDDASRDLRFPPHGIALTPEIRCRSYAAAPLVTPSGMAVGTLAVLAPEANVFIPEMGPVLEKLARQVITRLELYNRVRNQERVMRMRQRIERALTVERNFVSAVVDTMTAPVVVLDTAGRIVRFNRACEKLSGYNFGELAGRAFPEELIPAEERDFAVQMFEQARNRTLASNYEMHWKPRAGRKRRISWTATTLTDASDEVNFIIMTGVDVTEQREAEIAQRSSETRYRMLVEGSLGLVWTHDLDGRLLSVNAHAAKVLGYPVKELVGRRLTQLMTTAYSPSFKTYLEDFKQQEESQGLLYLRRKDGSTCVIAYSNRLLNLTESEPFVLGHGIDITEKTEAEEKLHMLMRQRESILESVADGICGMDMDGKLTFLNQSAANMLGYELEEALGQDMHSLMHHSKPDGSFYPASECPISNSLRSTTPTRVRDEVYWRKDGTCFPVEYVACPLVDEGRTTGIVVAFQDVTERRRLDRMKDEFISTVSHELRTPLTSLRAALGLIAGGVLDKRPEKAAQMLDVAIGNCDRLGRLVNDILDFERIGSGKLQLSRTELNASDLLCKAADLQHSSAAKANVHFRVEAEPITVWADLDRIQQTLANLIGNAIKFSPPDAEIRLRANVAGENEAIFEVRDQGRGIPADSLEMIFERFQQVDASDSRAMGGTGLGLAICRSIVSQHGGRIWAESKPGQGSSFFFTLPMRPPVTHEDFLRGKVPPDAKPLDPEF